MQWKFLLTAVSLSSLLLSACGTGDNAINDTAQNQDNAELRTVRYNPDGYPNNNAGQPDPAGYPGHPDPDHNLNRNVSYNRNQDNTNNTNQNNNNDNRMTVADKAAEKIAGMREVDRANVIVTDNNAYVAAKLTDNAGGKLTRDVEKKISDTVKSADRGIDRVYVSVNPDFYNRTTSYANDIRNGRPIEGMFDEFGELVRRVFPTER